MSHAKVAVSIHPASSRARALGGGAIPYSDSALAFAAAAVTLLAFGIYLRTMMPSTGFWDTGEAQTVPHTLSIFHPTGFPTYAMLGWLWSQLPIGEVAWRMNLLSAVSIALTSGLVVLITGHLVSERRWWLAAPAAAVSGIAFAFASEPWQNATRADVHAINALFVALVVWLLFAWRAAQQAASPRAGRWLVAAAFAFGLGMGAHPLIGLTAIGIAAWLFVVDRSILKRWRLIAVCAAVLALGMGSYAYIAIRGLIDPEPPLFYARPDTWEQFRYLVFAEQFRGLFNDFATPLANLGAKWRETERILAAQLIGPGWLVVAVGAAVLAVRQRGAFVFLALVVIANVVYSMNFRDGDIDRYYLPTLIAVMPLLGVALAATGATCARAVSGMGHQLTTRQARRALAGMAGGLVMVLGGMLAGASLVTNYASHDQSDNRDADEWVASVHAALPPNAVVLSWWSYSTPLWYHRWVLGERPDVTIIDERNVLDDGYRTMHRAIRIHLGQRPVFVVPPHWEDRELARRWVTRTVDTYPGFTDLLRIEGPRE